MADITKKERDAIAMRVAEALTSDKKMPAVRGAPKLASAQVALAAANPKQFFCQNWPLIRAGLEILKGFVPLPIKPVVQIVIKAGDAASSVICVPSWGRRSRWARPHSARPPSLPALTGGSLAKETGHIRRFGLETARGVPPILRGKGKCGPRLASLVLTPSASTFRRRSPASRR